MEEDLIQMIFESFRRAVLGQTYDFGSGTLSYSLGDDIPQSEVERLDLLADKIENRRFFSKRPEVLDFGSVIVKMLAEETSLRPKENQITQMHLSARYALDHVFKQIVRPGSKIALPVPNWNFWNKLPGVQEGNYSFEFFPAWNKDQLVDGFEKTARRGDISAVLLVNPSNPLGIHLDREVGIALDDIVQKYGIIPVVDDLLRGNQPIGQRETVAVSLSAPYVVEGFSHRFGEEFQSLSYVLNPEGRKQVHCKGEPKCLCSEILSLALQYATQPIVNQLVLRNAAFDEGMRQILPDIQITRPSDSSITSIVQLPTGVKMDVRRFSRETELNGININPVTSFYPPEVTPHNESNRLFRVAVGEMDVDQVRDGAMYLAKGIDYILSQGR